MSAGRSAKSVATVSAVLLGVAAARGTAGATAAAAQTQTAPCTATGLQSAIDHGGTLVFHSSCTVSLKQTLTVSAKDKVVINADGHSVTINGSAPDFPPTYGFVPVFKVDGSLTLDGITVAHGAALGHGHAGQGGGISVATSGHLTASDVAFSDDSAYGSAGADREPGTSGTEGSAPGQVGGDGEVGSPGGNAMPGEGGAVYVAKGATAVISASNFTGDQAAGGAGGGGASGGSGGQGGDAPSNSASGNGGKAAKGAKGGKGADGEGGAIYSAGTLTVLGGWFDGNHAIGGAGGPGGTGGTGGSAGQVQAPGGTWGNGSDGADGGDAGDGADGQGGAVFGKGKLSIKGAAFSQNTAIGGPGGSGGPGGHGGSGFCPRGNPADCGGNTAGNGADGGGGGDGGDGSGGAIQAAASATLQGDDFSQDKVGGGLVGPDCASGTGTACGGPGGLGGLYATTDGDAGDQGDQGKTGKADFADSNRKVAALPKLAIRTSRLGSARLHKAYAAALKATGGITPYRWSATGLPKGITVSPSTGKLHGKPKAKGKFVVKVVVTDPAASSPTKARASLALTVAKR